MPRILMVASEARPYAMTGGLADVIGALPAALAAQGEETGVVLPLYRSTQPHIAGAARVYDRMPVWLGPRRHDVDILSLDDSGVRWYFVDAPEFFDRPALYGENGEDYADNHVRFAVFCRAALDVIRHLFRPSIVHCHDWQAALMGPLIRHVAALDPTYYGMKILFTIHNLGYAGLFPRTALGDIGLDDSLFRPDRLEYWGKVNLLKGGIVYADAVSTVSKAYAREIQTSALGFGLEGVLRERAGVLHGIVNGVDYARWSPEHDPHIARPYSAAELDGKRACKEELLREFGLPIRNAATTPLLGIVSRFVGQKGFDLIDDIARELAREELNIVALGSGEPRYEQMFRDLAAAYPEKVAVRIAYDDGLAHRVEAGSDMFLMPSRYEPCGLNQIYSLRYGTIPIVRATGGLDDTIDEETGFKFREYSGEALLAAIRAALDAYRDKPRWLGMVRAAMARDFSWDASAAEYRTLYRRLIS